MLAMAQCTLVQTPPSEDWRYVSIFITYIKCNGHICKIVIDEGSSLNMVCRTVITYFGLSLELNPKPYSIAWVDVSSLLVTHRFQVSIKFSDYKDKVQ